MANKFISSIDNEEERVMHSKSDNKRIMISDEADEVIEELRCQTNLNSMRGSKFVFDHVHLLYYECHKINSNCGELYVDSLD